ncbi:hypothetical protein [Acidipila sp. EB88]|uniref:hypothetical protein n=1 Tax=Acidipila sp. EB88 TaxID=2305226 RepID=UPI00131511F5|nr:hypothetical protein [Acidipila sp. EB88]
MTNAIRTLSMTLVAVSLFAVATSSFAVTPTKPAAPTSGDGDTQSSQIPPAHWGGTQ